MLDVYNNLQTPKNFIIEKKLQVYKNLGVSKKYVFTKINFFPKNNSPTNSIRIKQKNFQ